LENPREHLQSGRNGNAQLGSPITDEEREKAMIARTAAQIPLNLLAQPSEIAKAVVFLAFDDSSCNSGAELLVDGGLAQV
jgi:NAD(P)-dependent dehydrogenase (short-subunit alcohol dehydrogenase family)